MKTAFVEPHEIAPLRALINQILATSCDSVQYFIHEEDICFHELLQGGWRALIFLPVVIWWEPREFCVLCDSYIEFPEMQGSFLKHRVEGDNVKMNFSVCPRRPALFLCDAWGNEREESRSS